MKEPDYEFYPIKDCIFSVAYDLLTLATDCLTDTPNGVPNDVYLSDGEPDFDCCDFLSIYPHTMRPIDWRNSGFPEENFQAVENCNEFSWAPRFEITVGRPCRPTIDTRSRSQPRPATDKDRTEHARAMYADSQAISCCVTNKIWNGYELGGKRFATSAVFPQQVYFDTFGVCSRIRFRIMLDINCCCTPEDFGYDDPDWVNRKIAEGPLGRTLPPLSELKKRM